MFIIADRQREVSNSEEISAVTAGFGLEPCGGVIQTISSERGAIGLRRNRDRLRMLQGLPSQLSVNPLELGFSCLELFRRFHTEEVYSGSFLRHIQARNYLESREIDYFYCAWF